MKPYYEEAGIAIYHGKSEHILPEIESVDVVITDPPYSEHVHSKVRRGADLPDGISRVTELGFSSLSAELRDICTAEFGRMAKRWVLTFSDIESSGEWRSALTTSGLQYVRTGAWVKLNATPQFSGDRPAPGFEVITIAHRPGRKTWNGGGTHAVWTHAIAIDRGGNGSREHTTQKPLPLMKQLVGLFSNPNEVVLDAFMGSGTTLVACKGMGRKAIGIEMEERYCETAANRLRQSVLNFESATEQVSA